MNQQDQITSGDESTHATDDGTGEIVAGTDAQETEEAGQHDGPERDSAEAHETTEGSEEEKAGVIVAGDEAHRTEAGERGDPS